LLDFNEFGIVGIIRLMSHILKLFLKIIHNRIHYKLDIDMDETQFGFPKGLGIRKAFDFVFNVLIKSSPNALRAPTKTA